MQKQVLTEKQLTFHHLLLSNGNVRLLMRINVLTGETVFLVKRGTIDPYEFYIFANALEAFNIVAGTNYTLEG